MRPLLVVGLLTAALVVYFVLLGVRAIELIRSGSAVAVGLGIGVLLLPLLGALVVAMELRFGVATGRLARRLRDGGGLPAGFPDPATLPQRPSGRVDRGAADAYFSAVRAQVEAAPEDWRGWYALGEAYDLAGDRKRARSAMRRAIALADQ